MERKVVALVSGGLDSMLAVKLMQLQGLAVHPVHLVGPWGCDEKAVSTLERQIGQPVHRMEKGADYLSLVRTPKFGYGKNMNPCIDCRIFMLKRLRPLVEKLDAAALVTGEVVGQRPMSQMRRQMRLIDGETGLQGRILRPLSAKRLEPTLAEQCGIVDREKLYGFAGRSRTPQLALAKKLGITDYSSPGGGCKLTTPGFTPKLRDFFAHYADADLRDAALLAHGRHLRIGDDVKLVVGRSEEENAFLLAFAEERPTHYTSYVPHGFSGPTVIAVGPVTPATDEIVGKVILRYARAQEMPPGGFAVRVVGADGERTTTACDAYSEGEVAALLIGAQEPPFGG